MKRANLHDAPLAFGGHGKQPLNLLHRPKPEPLQAVTCGYCEAPLDGRRKDARYCSDSHRTLAWKERHAA